MFLIENLEHGKDIIFGIGITIQKMLNIRIVLRQTIDFEKFLAVSYSLQIEIKIVYLQLKRTLIIYNPE